MTVAAEPSKDALRKHCMSLIAPTRVKTVPVKFGKTDPFSEEAILRYEKALVEAQNEGVRVKALILCSPHNPLGKGPTSVVRSSDTLKISQVDAILVILSLP